MAIESVRAAFRRALQIADPKDATLDIVDELYLASMMTEEGSTSPLAVVLETSPKLDSLEFTDADDDRGPLWFVVRFAPLELTAKCLKRMARGTQYGRDLIVVDYHCRKLVGIAQRRELSDGGHAAHIAAPRPGVIILEGRNNQVAGKYADGALVPLDSDVLNDPGPVLEALRACEALHQSHAIGEMLRHARMAKHGAMFLFLRKPNADSLIGSPNYALGDRGQISRLLGQERPLLLQRIEVAITAETATRAQREAENEADARAQANDRDIRAALQMLGTFASVDGAVVVEPNFRVCASGFIIGGKGGQDLSRGPQPDAIVCRDAAGRDRSPRPVGGGARHKAGLAFAWENPGSVVVIVSADGPVTCALSEGDELLTWSVRVSET